MRSVNQPAAGVRGYASRRETVALCARASIVPQNIGDLQRRQSGLPSETRRDHMRYPSDADIVVYDPPASAVTHCNVDFSVTRDAAAQCAAFTSSPSDPAPSACSSPSPVISGSVAADIISAGNHRHRSAMAASQNSSAAGFRPSMIRIHPHLLAQNFYTCSMRAQSAAARLRFAARRARVQITVNHFSASGDRHHQHTPEMLFVRDRGASSELRVTVQAAHRRSGVIFSDRSHRLRRLAFSNCR